MKRIYLFCSAGMPTNLVASRMQDVADSILPLSESVPDRNIITFTSNTIRHVLLASRSEIQIQCSS